MQSFTIRPIVPGDIQDLVIMIHELTAFHNDAGGASIESVTRDTIGPSPWWQTYVAEDDTKLVGYMVLLPLSKIADGWRGIDLNHMYVRETHRGKGIDRALVEAAKTYAKSNACTYMFIATAPDNTAAQAAYLACQFEARPDSDGPRFRIQL